MFLCVLLGFFLNLIPFYRDVQMSSELTDLWYSNRFILLKHAKAYGLGL